ncbi:MgtC/SapB family protein [Alkalihalobacillus sp. MEB130]|uniref:MgtC/SapB family protein n=1 Tax=Alkalihalobacillus sp. MEB130 TaxID=2976704 RepID=UPI0028DD5E96|nr:MgtC/SapB family protein [Alkalihalobacillus sp. MEB130]MDT8862850.1 MgtC/SapB family protein [Alkalihalobacillus sp. MEB130]
MFFDLVIVGKLTLALLLGMLIGIDRQLKHKPLGLKTCMVISVASCLVTIVSLEAFYMFATPTFNAMDPMRLTAQIVSGVGFLGAGVILRRSNDVISGLTSAAMIWSASGLGIAVGVGLYFASLVAVVLLIVAVNLLPAIIKKVGPRALRERDVFAKIVMEPNYKMTDLLLAIEKNSEDFPTAPKSSIQIRNVKIRDLEGGKHQIKLTISAPETLYTTEIYYRIKNIKHVLTVELDHV